MIVPLRGWFRPVIERSVVDLPAPFAPMSVTISPSRTVDRDPLQRLDRAVVRLDAVQLEQRLPLRVHDVLTAAVPRYASMTRSFFWISPGVPSAIFSP